MKYQELDQSKLEASMHRFTARMKEIHAEKAAKKPGILDASTARTHKMKKVSTALKKQKV